MRRAAGWLICEYVLPAIAVSVAVTGIMIVGGVIVVAWLAYVVFPAMEWIMRMLVS